MTNIADFGGSVSKRHQAPEKRVQASAPIAIKQILVPTDLTDESQKAVSYSLVLARCFGAHLTLLHVYQEPYSVDYLRGPQACAAVSELRRNSEIALAALLEQVAERHADCSAEFRYGAVCEEIVKTAKEREIDMMVISTHQYNWLMRLAYGCDAEQILRRAACPILIVFENEHALPSKTSHFGRTF